MFTIKKLKNNLKLMSIVHSLPGDIVRYIYRDFYYHWVVEELQFKYPKQNRYVVKSGRLFFDSIVVCETDRDSFGFPSYVMTDICRNMQVSTCDPHILFSAYLALLST
jgi:hypothetical protein